MKGQPMTRGFAAAAALGCALALGAFTAAHGQTATGTVRGFVKNAQGQPVAAVSVTAVQAGTNFQRSVLSTDNGFFSIPGLPAGQYVVRTTMVGFANQEHPVRLLIGQTLNLDFVLTEQAIALAGLQVETRRVVETTSTEVATNITQEQIQSIPMNDRNFLSLALLAPGIRSDGASITSGAESANNINVFVDGVSFKNDILKGGVAGQDASKGNPFPQIAVQEFRVVTQQYKAEYQKATSAIVTAQTRSGTNEFKGEVFGFRQDEHLIEKSFFVAKTCTDSVARNPAYTCTPKAKQARWQLGGSLGGPIMRDKLFFFAAYEGNHQDREGTVIPRSLERWPTDLQNELSAHGRTFPSEFRSNLYFGKLTYTPHERHRFELSGNVRDEFDVRNFGGTDSFENAEHFNNDVNTFLLKHQYNRGNLLNEAQVSYQKYRWFPIQLNPDIPGRNYAGSLKIGGRCCPQDQTQRKLELRNDVSYTVAGLAGDHVFKLGGVLDFVEYDIIKQLNVNPQFTFQPANPTVPTQVEIGFGQPNIGAENTQLGVFVQDDWSLSARLTLNLGLRWDYESNALNNDYVTPANVLSELRPRTDLILINDNYFTDGNDRPAYKGMFQPRLGFSFDLSGNNSTVLFGGWGVYYDRNSYATTIGERERLVWTTYLIRFSPDGSTPGTVRWDPAYLGPNGRNLIQAAISSGTFGKPEVFLMHNETRPPRSNHLSAGVRQAWRNMLFSLNYTGVRTYNQFTWMFANRNPLGATASTFETPSFRNVIVSTDEGRSWYDAIFLKAEKPYSQNSRWGAQLAYTLSWADAEFEAGADFGGLSFRTPDDFVRRRSANDERHRVTANWIIGLPLAFRFSGILTLGSGTPYRVFYGGNACTTGDRDCVGNEYPNGQSGKPWGGTNPFTGEPSTDVFLGLDQWAFRNTDLRLEKEFAYRGQTIGLVAEVFNVFNHANFTGYDGRLGDLTTADAVLPNANFGARTGVITDTRFSGAPRRWQFGLRYSGSR